MWKVIVMSQFEERNIQLLEGLRKTTYPLDKPVSGPASKERTSKIRSQNANTALRNISSTCLFICFPGVTTHCGCIFTAQ
jgi:hypothetical protein